MSNIESKREETIANRRSFMAQATELLAAVPLVGYAATNWNKQDQYKVLSMEAARMPGAALHQRGEVSDVFRGQATFANASDELNSAYRSSYHKSRTIMVPYYNGKTTTMRPQTTYYWDVPRGLPDESVISRWKGNESRAYEKIAAIKDGKLIDVEKLKEVAIATKNGDDTARRVLTGFVYGSSVAMLWGYEEAISFVKAKANGTSYHHERYEKTTATQETRRGFIKIGAALLGAGAAAMIHNKIQTRLANGEARLEGELKTADNTARLSEDAAIEWYYGETVEQSIVRVRGEVSQAERALLSGKADGRVSNALRTFVQSGSAYADSLEAASENEETKAALAYLAKCRTVTSQLEAAGNVDERIATSAALLEGAGIVGVMALVVVPGRILNQRNPGQKDLYPRLNSND